MIILSTEPRGIRHQSQSPLFMLTPDKKRKHYNTVHETKKIEDRKKKIEDRKKKNQASSELKTEKKK